MRLIDADALLYDLEIVPLTDDGGVDANDLDDIIKRQPTIEERKTGRWMQSSPFTKPRCSECGESCFGLHGFDYTVTNYCPNCGAKMED